MSDVSLLWLRNDLRLHDNPALQAALACGGPIVPVFIWAPDEEAPWSPGAASRWWLHESLSALAAQFLARGSRLILRRGDSLATLRDLLEATGARRIFWNRRYEPAVIARDKVIKASLREAGVVVETFNGNLLFEPWTVQTADGNPYRVFTPFWRACGQGKSPGVPIAAPSSLPGPVRWPRSESLTALGLLPRIDWTAGMRATWQPGEAGAEAALERFIDAELVNYREGRDLPSQVGTSRLSPHLHFGEISPRQIWHAVQKHTATTTQPGLLAAGEAYLRQLGWREFAHHLLFHYPQTAEQPLRAEFAAFAWADDEDLEKAWRRGQTGFPIIDAGMRELWATGWMHNRVRMIVASFLVKDLLLSWQTGSRWFWDTLVDADLANNTLGWQWTAGCGADAAPFFRIFNPLLQGEKFDAAGDYVRRWVPELAALPNKWIHKPWQAPVPVLRGAGIELGSTYPRPIVDHGEARARALQAFDQIKRR